MPRVLCLPWLPWWLIQVSPSTCRPKPPSHSLLFQRVLGVGLARLDVEGVRRGPQADDRLARLDVVDDVLHLVVGQVAEAGEDDHQVGRLERLQAGDVVVAVGVDRAVLGIDGEQDGAVEAVVLGQDLGQLRQRLLGAVLLVAADQDDVLALAGAVAALDRRPTDRRRRPGPGGTGRRGRRGNRGAFTAGAFPSGAVRDAGWLDANLSPGLTACSVWKGTTFSGHAGVAASGGASPWGATPTGNAHPRSWDPCVPPSWFLSGR